MNVLILAGGKGTRLGSRTELRPKPMVEVGDRPIIRHIIDHYRRHGHHRFHIALGHQADVIRDWAADVAASDADLRLGEEPPPAGWSLHLHDTGEESLTATRIRHMEAHLGEERFLMTWGDGVSDVDLDAVIDFHRTHGRLATVTAVRPPARYGHLEIESDGRVAVFDEKPQAAEGWINGAFFVLEPGIFEYIPEDRDLMWEHEPMRRLAEDGELMAFQHHGFWQCMDTRRDHKILEDLWSSGTPPWIPR